MKTDEAIERLDPQAQKLFGLALNYDYRFITEDKNEIHREA